MTQNSAIDRLVALTFPYRHDPVAMAQVEAVARYAYKRYETCWHESGHAVSAVVLGAQIRSVVVPDDEGLTDPSGLTSIEPDSFPAGRKAAIAYAGPWAQARWIAGRRPTLRQLYSVMQHHTPATDGAVLCASGGTAAGSDVVPLMERCWPAVAKVASKLLIESRASHEDVCSALGLSRHSRGIELAMIRSGSSPGSFRVTAPR